MKSLISMSRLLKPKNCQPVLDVRNPSDLMYSCLATGTGFLKDQTNKNRNSEDGLVKSEGKD